MADKKITQLDAKAVLDGTEQIVVVHDPAGSPITKRSTAQALADLIVSASQIAEGTVELATDAETLALADTGRAVTPSNLGALAASETQKGIVELSTWQEADTVTSDTLAVTPKAFARSNKAFKSFELKIIDDVTVLTTGDGKLHLFIPSRLDGWVLVDADACVSTVSSSGTPTIQIYNVSQTVDMLSTRITIDANEKKSWTAATPPVIDGANNLVYTGEELRIDVDVAGTGAKGLTVILVFAQFVPA